VNIEPRGVDPTLAPAARLGFPRLAIERGVYVEAGEAAWTRFLAACDRYDDPVPRIAANVALAACEDAQRGVG
jgi:hypothetical protein